MHITNLSNISSINYLVGMFFLFFTTLISVYPLSFPIETLGFMHMCIYVPYIYTNSLGNISSIPYLEAILVLLLPYLSRSLEISMIESSIFARSFYIFC